MSKFILGGGISGLVWKFYNPEFEVITPHLTRPENPKIKAADPFVKSSMIWLHDTPQTRQLLTDLGFQNVEKKLRKSRIGYYDNGVIRDKLTPELKAILVEKKMTPWDEEIKPIEFKEDSTRLSLTGVTEGANFMNVLDVDHGEIMYKLSQKCPTTHGYIGEIRDDVIGITNEPPHPGSGYTYSKYDTIISTIPAPAFGRSWLNGHPAPKTQLYPSYKSLPITFARFRRKVDEFDGNYEMVYYDNTVPFTRISHLGNHWSVEFTGSITDEKVREIFPKHANYLSEVWQLPQGRIFSEKLTAPDKVIFSGRFATWNHAITTEHVIKEAMNYARRKTKTVGRTK